MVRDRERKPHGYYDPHGEVRGLALHADRNPEPRPTESEKRADLGLLSGFRGNRSRGRSAGRRRIF